MASQPKSHPLDRRSFLRLCLLAGGGTLLAACSTEEPGPVNTTQPPQPPGASPTPIPPEATPTAVPLPQPAIRLEGRDTDVWTWNRVVWGRIEEGEPVAGGTAAGKRSSENGCQSIEVLANGSKIPAELETSAETNQPGEEGVRRFSAGVPIVEGENQLVALCSQESGAEIASPTLTLTGRLKQRPKAVIRMAVAEGRLVLDGSPSEPDEREAHRIIDSIWSARPGNPTAVQVESAPGMPEREFRGEVSAERITLALPPMEGEYYFDLRVVDEAGEQDHAAAYVEVRDGQWRIPDYATENPAWVENTIIYGIICHKYGPPAFKGIMRELDYLRELGVNALWLSPANVSPADDYGYAIVDYFDLNPTFGTKTDFHLLVQEAHARGIRVLMDFVPNHSSAQHPYYRDAEELQRESLTWDFYDRDPTGAVTYYFDWAHLPNLNYDNPAVQRMMLEAFSYWVREFDVDGFRVDVAWGIRERRPDFWPLWRTELKRIKPDLLLLAEASARDPFYFDNGFDAAYDWTQQLGTGAWELVWGSYKNRLLAYNLQDALTNRPDGFHPDALIFRFLNNNDTGKRFITRQGEAMTRVATALLLTLPGLPCIYTGDEIGAEFHPYQDQGPLDRTENYPGLREYHQKLIGLRKEYASLHSRQWEAVEVEPIPQEVFGYVRFIGEADQPVLVLLNFSEESAEVTVKLPEKFGTLAAQGRLYDLLAEEGLPVGRGPAPVIPVPALSARILIPPDQLGATG